MFALILFLLIALAMTFASGELVWIAWHRGFGDAGVYVSLAHICSAVVILIAAGEDGWPAFVLAAAWVTMACAVIAVPVGEQQRSRKVTWEDFERDFRFYDLTRSWNR